MALLKRGRSNEAIGLLGPPLYPEPICEDGAICARRSMATRVSGSRRPPFPVDDDHLFRSMATRATGLWTGVMNAVG